MKKIIICGDFVPTRSNYTLFANGETNELLDSSVRNILSGSYFRIFNLEAPITDNKEQIKKSGPNLKIPSDNIKGIKLLKPDLLLLANNHILDYGADGLNSTTSLLKKNAISFVGAGVNLQGAREPHIITVDSIKIGIYACTESEFSCAKEGLSGANPFDHLESLDHIALLKQQCDYVIVFYHGGKEHYRYPTPYEQKVCRKMVDKGANLIVCQHSHCIGATEKYNDSIILYGQGNFLFDYSQDDCWKTGLLIEVSFPSKMEVKYIPICKDGNRVRIATEAESKTILREFKERSQKITRDGFVEAQYTKLIIDNIWDYISLCSGLPRIIRKLDSLTGRRLTRLLYNEKKLLTLQNLVRCESHRENLIEGIDKIVSDANRSRA